MSNQYQVYKYAKKKDRVQKKKVITDTCDVSAWKAANTARKSLQKGEIRVPPPPGKNRPNGEKGPQVPGNQKPKNKHLRKGFHPESGEDGRRGGSRKGTKGKQCQVERVRQDGQDREEAHLKTQGRPWTKTLHLRAESTH